MTLNYLTQSMICLVPVIFLQHLPVNFPIHGILLLNVNSESLYMTLSRGTYQKILMMWRKLHRA